MKKFTSFLFVLFACMAVNAQFKLSVQSTNCSFKTSGAATGDLTKIPDQSIPIGYCSYFINELGGIGTGGNVDLSAAIQLPASMFNEKGNKIFAIRFALSSTSVSDIKVFISKDLDGDPLRSQSVEFVKEGWNYVVFDAPYNIDTDDIYLGYSFHTSAYAIGTEEVKSTNKKADLVAINGQWTNLSSEGITGTAIAIQAMVTGGDYSSLSTQSAYDAAIENVSIKTYVRKDETCDFNCSVANYGINTLKKFDIVYKVGEKTETLNVTDVAIPNGASSIFKLPEQTFTEEGVFPIKIYVSNLNGSEEDALAANDTIEKSIECIEQFFDRKSLFEVFTGQECGYCPSGHDIAKTATEGMEDKVIWVAHHAGYKSDIFTISEDNTYASFFRVQGAPSCMLDRSLSPYSKTTVVFDPRQTTPAIFNNALEIPTYASVKIDASFNEETRELTATVSGTMLKDLPNAKLNLFLTQSGYVAAQANGGNNYVHNNFMRKVLSATYGDEIVLTDGNYSKTYTYTIPEKIGTIKCDVNNMSLVAFVADYTSSNNKKCEVHNADKFDLAGFDTAINNVDQENVTLYTDNNHTVHINGAYDLISVYSSNGTLIKTISSVNSFELGSGLYIIRISSNNNFINRKVVL